MKLCKKNIEKNNSLFSPFETDEHYDNRRTILVANDYNFNNEDDIDATSDLIEWEKHYQRLKINYYHFLKIVQGVLIPKCNPNYPTLDYSGIDNLSDEEKRIGTKYHALPYSFRVLTTGSHQVSDGQDSINFRNLLYLSKYARAEIVELMREKVGDRMRTGVITLTASQKFFRDSNNMLQYYENTSDPEFKVWLLGTDDSLNSGYDHSSTGFSSKDYYVETIKNDLEEIITGEHYD